MFCRIYKKAKSATAVYSKTLTLLDPIWEQKSAESKRLLKAMLTKDPTKRITASEALKSSFFSREKEEEKKADAGVMISLKKLRSFRIQMNFQKAVLTYIASQQVSQKDQASLMKTFDMLDLDKDGRISKEELIVGYMRMYGDYRKAEKQARSVLERIDLNKSGVIEYNGIYYIPIWVEFLVANLNIVKDLSEGNLREAFDFYDKVKL